MHYLYKIINKINFEVYNLFSSIYVFVSIRALKIKIKKGRKINGFPRFIIKKNSKIDIGENFAVNSGYLYNPIGRNQRCIFSVAENAKLKIGDNVGLSSVAIICQTSIIIGNNVKIGGNTLIYDTDFHSLDFKERVAFPEITSNIKRKKVVIGDNVFIGGHSIILKGVEIGSNSIVGAGSVVSKNIPPNQIWAGNPARFIKEIIE